MEVRLSVGKAGSMSKRREAAFAEPALDGEVEVGERVTVLDLTTGAVSDYRIGEAGVSPGSPLGAALLGRRVGDVAVEEVDDGVAERAARVARREVDRHPHDTAHGSRAERRLDHPAVREGTRRRAPCEREGRDDEEERPEPAQAHPLESRASRSSFTDA